MAPSRGVSGDLTIAERVAWHRRRRGLSRRALAELMGRSEEWLRLLETKGQGAERLGTLMQLARVLRLPDLQSLVGQPVLLNDGSTPRHPQAEAVRRAMTATLIPGPGGEKVSVPDLRRRTQQAWTAWHTSREQYTALGLLLPDLLRDAGASMRQPGSAAARAEAQTVSTHVFLLTQRFAFCVGESELAARSCDRAILAAQETGDRQLVGLAAWSTVMTSLAADRPEEAADLAAAADAGLSAAAGPDEAAIRGSLLLFAAIAHARARLPSDAWRCWDMATAIASRLPAGTEHQQTMFGHANVAIYAVALAVETGDAAAALDRARCVRSDQIPSTNRRAQHYLDTARSHHRRGDWQAATATLTASLDASREAILFDPYARGLVTDLVRRVPAASAQVLRLGRHLNVL